MNPLFISSPSDADIARAVKLWPELSGKRVRPLLVTAFGDIYVETEVGEVLVASPIELTCERIAPSVQELEKLFSDQGWAEEQLITELALLAKERGKIRAAHQVYAVAPHPCFTGKLQVENLTTMDLHIWHHICSQLRAQQNAQTDRA
jgi:hypothetical protein